MAITTIIQQGALLKFLFHLTFHLAALSQKARSINAHSHFRSSIENMKTNSRHKFGFYLPEHTSMCKHDFGSAYGYRCSYAYWNSLQTAAVAIPSPSTPTSTETAATASATKRKISPQKLCIFAWHGFLERFARILKSVRSLLYAVYHALGCTICAALRCL